MICFCLAITGNFCRLFITDWRGQLEMDLLSTQKSAFAAGTIKNLRSQWSKFAKFTQLMGDELLPIDSHTLCLYIQFLSRSLRSPQSINNYVHGLKLLHRFLTLPFPSTSAIEIKLTLRGVVKTLNHIPNQATPITPQILRRIVRLLDESDAFHCVIKALFLFLFLLFSRKAQFVPDSLSSHHMSSLVLRSDVSATSFGLLVKFRKTKTRQAGGAPLCIPLVKIPGSPLCPVSAYNDMSCKVPAPPSAPLFILPPAYGSVPLQYASFHKVLRQCVSTIGLNPNIFSSHSFRRGGATFAFAAGVPGQLIQSQGDWKSECYKMYIDLSVDHRVQVAKSLSAGLAD